MLRIFRHYVSGLAFILFLGDVAVISAALYITELSAAWAGYAPFAARLAEAAAIITFVLYVGDLYQVRQAIGPRELVARVLICQGAAAMVVALVARHRADDATAPCGRRVGRRRNRLPASRCQRAPAARPIGALLSTQLCRNGFRCPRR